MSPTPATVAALLAWARPAGVDRLDAQLLLSHHLGRPRAWILGHGDAPVGKAAADAFRAAVARRAGGEPLAYLTGEWGFHGLTLQVSPAVLVPRPDTEVLVDWALEQLTTGLAPRPRPRVIDLGTGSGAIALALRQACPRAVVHATDVSAEALAVARANGDRLGLPVQWWLGDWWQAVPDDAPAFDLVVSNPPYIAAGDPHLAALGHEPALALTPLGGDGLAAIDAVLAGAGTRLAPGAWLLFEHGHDQAAAVRDRMGVAGFVDIGHRVDLGGHRRCTGGRWPAPGRRPDATVGEKTPG